MSCSQSAMLLSCGQLADDYITGLQGVERAEAE
jgi:hypothetical protein